MLPIVSYAETLNLNSTFFFKSPPDVSDLVSSPSQVLFLPCSDRDSCRVETDRTINKHFSFSCPRQSVSCIDKEKRRQSHKQIAARNSLMSAFATQVFYYSFILPVCAALAFKLL